MEVAYQGIDHIPPVDVEKHLILVEERRGGRPVNLFGGVVNDPGTPPGGFILLAQHGVGLHQDQHGNE